MASEESDELEGAEQSSEVQVSDISVDPRFADWYRTVGDQKTPGVPQSRTKGLTDFLRDASLAERLDAVRFFFGASPADPGFLANFHKYFNTVDPSFGLQDSEHALRVLAGISAGLAMAEEGVNSDLVALAIRCSTLQGETIDVPVEDREGPAFSDSFSVVDK